MTIRPRIRRGWRDWNLGLGMTASLSLVQAFFQARAKYKDLYSSWRELSFSLGSRLPDSLLTPSIQREGEVDLLIRCMEDDIAEIVSSGESNDLFIVNYLHVMSGYWVGGMYEIFRLLRERRLIEETEFFMIQFRDLESVRISLEKHEIAKDRILKGPLVMTKQGSGGVEPREYTYAPKENQRAHIMPTGITNSGSMTWQVIDVKAMTSRWVERRSLSNHILELAPKK